MERIHFHGADEATAQEKTVDALKATGNDDALGLMAQARIFLSEGKVNYLLFPIRFCF